MEKTVGQYGMREIVIVPKDSGFTVWVWDKYNPSSPTIGAYTLEKTSAESIAEAKELAISAIAKEDNSDAGAVRTAVTWS